MGAAAKTDTAPPSSAGEMFEIATDAASKTDTTEPSSAGERYEIATDAAAPTSGNVCALAAPCCALVPLRVGPAWTCCVYFPPGVQLGFFNNDKKKIAQPPGGETHTHTHTNTHTHGIQR